MMSQQDLPALIQKYKEAILNTAHSFKVEDIKLFGSVARGECDDKSDIDFLVSFSEDAGLYDLIGLKQALEELLKCSVDIATPNGLKARIKERVLNEAISL